MGAIPMPNKLMWHLYQTASHVKRHLDTMLHTANGAFPAVSGESCGILAGFICLPS